MHTTAPADAVCARCDESIPAGEPAVSVPGVYRRGLAHRPAFPVPVMAMPDWLVITVAIAAPLLGFAGAAIGQLVARRASRELDVWRRREETMRMLRWAAELTTRPESGALGLSVLDSLSSSEMLQKADQPLVRAVLATVTARAAAIYTEDEATGGTDEHTDND